MFLIIKHLHYYCNQSCKFVRPHFCVSVTYGRGNGVRYSACFTLLSLPRYWVIYVARILGAQLGRMPSGNKGMLRGHVLKTVPLKVLNYIFRMQLVEFDLFATIVLNLNIFLGKFKKTADIEIFTATPPYL